MSNDFSIVFERLLIVEVLKLLRKMCDPLVLILVDHIGAAIAQQLLDDSG